MIAHRWYSPYFTMGPLPPQNCQFPCVDLDPHLIRGSLGPFKSITQRESRSVQTGRPTIRYSVRPSVTIVRIYEVLRCGLKSNTFNSKVKTSKFAKTGLFTLMTDRQVFSTGALAINAVAAAVVARGRCNSIHYVREYIIQR